MASILQALRKMTDDDVEMIQQNLEKAQFRRHAISKAIDPDTLTYSIFLRSLWEKEGEKNLKMKKRGSLAKLIKKAEAKFKEINRRSGVQAKYTIFVHFANRTKMPLPKHVWVHLSELH